MPNSALTPGVRSLTNGPRCMSHASTVTCGKPPSKCAVGSSHLRATNWPRHSAASGSRHESLACRCSHAAGAVRAHRIAITSSVCPARATRSTGGDAPKATSPRKPAARSSDASPSAYQQLKLAELTTTKLCSAATLTEQVGMLPEALVTRRRGFEGMPWQDCCLVAQLPSLRRPPSVRSCDSFSSSCDSFKALTSSVMRRSSSSLRSTASDSTASLSSLSSLSRSSNRLVANGGDGCTYSTGSIT
jgi:hypothetical protein